MKNRILLFLLVCLLSGCATYKIQKGRPPYDKGYVASKDSYVIAEYTIGKDNAAPADKQVAQERFKRRKNTVEQYYQKMGYLESRAKEVFLDPPLYLLKFMFGIFRLPSIMVSDYKYNRDPKYRDKVDMLEETEDEKEQERVKKLRAELGDYIKKDLAGEPAGVEERLAKAVVEDAAAAQVVQEARVAAVVRPQETPVEAPQPPVLQKQAPVSIPAASKEEAESKALAQTPAPKKEPPKPKAKPISKPAKEEPPSEPVAVITANPAKGPAPLRVHFSAGRSYSKGARIVAYSWEFGDGDTSNRIDPINTYWSTTYGSRYFVVTLTVRDNKGNTAVATTTVEVTTK